MTLRSAIIRYNRIAYWKQEEVFEICSYLELPRKTDGRTDEGQRLTRHTLHGRRTMCIAGPTALSCWSQVTASEINRLSSTLLVRL